MEYFYAPPPAITPPTLTIAGEEFSHLTHVMRMREGDVLRVVDGAGHAYDAVIASIGRHEAACRITAAHDRLHEPARNVTLGAGLLKNPSRFDYLVEKAVEIGVARIVPLLTERTIPRQGKRERWQKLCVAAMKQSGRCVLPRVDDPLPFGKFIAGCTVPVKLIPHQDAAEPLGAAAPGGAEAAALCIGPEGGFSDAEIDAARAAGFRPVSLGERRLRAETAALVACAMLIARESGA
ncbi:MAG TPA: 16S rRNA (uracil(1498)-N(3))-methyltransferase [Bacteroidota bacterium]|nr:16S rRNA (uracil(1498)-N(3))-methyltransferase [Bacteroidota bacterium]